MAEEQRLVPRFGPQPCPAQPLMPMPTGCQSSPPCPQRGPRVLGWQRSDVRERRGGSTRNSCVPSTDAGPAGPVSSAPGSQDGSRMMVPHVPGMSPRTDGHPREEKPHGREQSALRETCTQPHPVIPRPHRAQALRDGNEMFPSQPSCEQCLRPGCGIRAAHPQSNSRGWVLAQHRHSRG